MIWAFIANYIGVSCENCCSFITLKGIKKRMNLGGRNDNQEEDSQEEDDESEFISFLINKDVKKLFNVYRQGLIIATNEINSM